MTNKKGALGERLVELVQLRVSLVNGCGVCVDMHWRDDTDAAWPALREHFTDAEIAELGYTIAAIRGWNSINPSLRNQIPEQPAPGM